MGIVSIVRPGMFVTVQDLGRWGFQSRGVPVCGAMDGYSHRLANRLVGNSDKAATFEATLIGPQITFESATAFAITGAEFDLSLDAVPIEPNREIQASAGMTLKFGQRLAGARSYIAVAGGLEVPEVLGSRSTHVLTRMGGLEGRALRAGDRLSTGEKSSGTRPFFQFRPLALPKGGARLRVVPGESGLFEHLSSQRFQISSRSDRMGYRLEGKGLTGQPPGEMISAAVGTGSIQVPPNGQPILLMSDHATTGGYAVGATVIAADLPIAGQLAPGDWIELEACSIEAAENALRQQEAALGSV